jgi:uncharacterized iron-regulated membrane protein
VKTAIVLLLVALLILPALATIRIMLRKRRD